jgi:hypothetical protein
MVRRFWSDRWHCANEALQERQGLVNLIGLELMGNIRSWIGTGYSSGHSSLACSRVRTSSSSPFFSSP